MSLQVLSKLAKAGMLMQTNFATPATAASNFITMAAKDVGVTVQDVNLVVNDLNYMGAHGSMKEEKRRYTEKITALKSLPFTGNAVLSQIAPNLALAFGTVTEGLTINGSASDLQGLADIQVDADGADPTGLGFRVGQTISIDGQTFGGETTTTIKEFEIDTIVLDVPADVAFTDKLLTVLDVPKLFKFPDGNGIDYKANAAKLFSYAQTGGTAGDGVILESAIIESYSISVDNNGEADAERAKEDFKVTGNKLTTGVTFSGTWTTIDEALLTYFKNFTLDLIHNGITYSALCWDTFKFTITKTITPACKTASKASQYKVTYECKVELQIPKDSVTIGILNGYNNNVTEVSLEFYNSATKGMVHGDLAFFVTKGYLNGSPDGTDGDYQVLKLNIDVLRPNAGWNDVVKVADSIDWGF